MTVRLLARSVRGLEWVVADEIASTLPAGRLDLAPREVRFAVPGIDAAVLALRTVDDVFVVAGETPDLGHTKDVPPRLAAALAELDWASALAALEAVREVPRDFDVVASFAGSRNYNRYALEDAVGDALASRIGGGFLSRRPSPDGRPARMVPAGLSVRIFPDGTTVTAALRVAPRPLHRREYKQDTGPGTLHPPLAAALARLAHAPAVAVDPCCGDGTIAIELAAAGGKVFAADLSVERIRNAVANARRADAVVTFAQADAGHLPLARCSVDAVVTNPPWEVAVPSTGSLAGSLHRFWTGVRGVLKPSGVLCTVVDGELDAPAQLRDAGFRVGLAVRVRLAGRMSRIVLCAPPGAPVPRLSGGLARWRACAHGAGVVTDEGF